jgi:hypothetical protein
MFDESTAVFLADFGVPCTANGQAFTGLLDRPDTQLSIGEVTVMSTQYLLTAATADIASANVREGTAITVDGQPYKARELRQVDDGVFTQIDLTKT